MLAQTNQCVCLSLSTSALLSIPLLAKGVGAFSDLGLGLQPIPILPEEVHNSYSKRMDGRGGLAKQRTAPLPACLAAQ